jgi:peptide methionine sulfoxide reductase MsrA
MFSCVPGVVNTSVGYMGGPGVFPVYDNGMYGATPQNHSETVLVEYDPTLVG